MRTFLTSILFSYCSLVFAERVPTIAEISVELAAQPNSFPTEKISFIIDIKNAEAYAEQLQNRKNITTRLIDNNALLITMTENAIIESELIEQYSNSSFVIDLEEDSTKQFLAGFVNQNTEHFTMQSMVTYVSNYINEPTYIHGFNIASVVAEQRSGDCTEYAVLTTALARSLKLPAKVMIGTVIIEEEGKPMAYGHAWSEVWYKNEWHVADSALFDDEQDTDKKHYMYYLPSAELKIESSGYVLSLLNALTFTPHSIRELRGHP